MRRLLVWSRLPGGLAALFSGLALAALILGYMTGVGAEVILAIIAALTPSPAP